MATLLHLDSAVFPQGSASREVTATFVQTWLEQHPDGQVVYRDLAANPLPHLDAAAAAMAPGTHCAASSPPNWQRRTPS